MNITTVIGARPQFIKAAPVSKALADAGIGEDLVHTGQHYDSAMSAVFFEELGLKEPKTNLELGGGGHGEMTGRMLEKLEAIFLEARPDWVLVYGDTNSTLAGALAASKLHIPVCHVEAGLRSYNRRMPEEVNRVLTDHISNRLFCSSEVGVENLKKEGIVAGTHVVGDIMADASRFARELVAGREQEFLRRAPVELLERDFLLLTLHRAENTDERDQLVAMVEHLNALDETEIIFPIHPRTRGALEREDLRFGDHVHLIDPVGYLEMAVLLSRAALVLTDSGGLQKEAYWAATPCVTLRPETEWVETIEEGANVLWQPDHERDLKSVVSEWHGREPSWTPNAYGDGRAAVRIAELMAGSKVTSS